MPSFSLKKVYSRMSVCQYDQYTSLVDSLYSKMWQSQHSKEGLNVVEKKEKNADAMELLILDEDKCCGSSSCNR